MFSFFILIYNFLYSALRVLLYILKPLLPAKLRGWISLRDNYSFLQNQLPEKNNKRIWFHAASGEIEYAKAIIREIKLNYPETSIYISYSSPSAPRLFKNWGCSIDGIFSINWDTSNDNQKLISLLKPDLIVFSRTDYWPNLIYQAKKANIKLAAISTFPKTQSFNFKLTKLLLRHFNYISCVTLDLTKELQKNIPQVKITHAPDTRFDQACYRLSLESQLKLPNTNKYITLGSTWPEDERIFLNAVTSILQFGYKVIWAPHEIDHVLDLQNKIKDINPNVSITLHSNYSNATEFDVYIIDKVGYLADAYRYSTIAFVGGSFKAKVHSVMEPLCANNIVLVGPHHTNNPEALYFKKAGLLHVVNNTEHVIQLLSSMTLEKQKNQKLLIQNEISHLTGGSKTTAADLINLIC